MTTTVESITDIKVANLPEHGGPCFYLDSEGNGDVPSHEAPPVVAGDRIPVKGNANVIREQRKMKLKQDGGPSPEPNPTHDRSASRGESSPEPEHHIEPKDGRSKP